MPNSISAPSATTTTPFVRRPHPPRAPGQARHKLDARPVATAPLGSRACRHIAKPVVNGERRSAPRRPVSTRRTRPSPRRPPNKLPKGLWRMNLSARSIKHIPRIAVGATACPIHAATRFQRLCHIRSRKRRRRLRSKLVNADLSTSFRLWSRLRQPLRARLRLRAHPPTNRRNGTSLM